LEAVCQQADAQARAVFPGLTAQDTHLWVLFRALELAWTGTDVAPGPGRIREYHALAGWAERSLKERTQ
jgi:hypothetical protein